MEHASGLLKRAKRLSLGRVGRGASSESESSVTLSSEHEATASALQTLHQMPPTPSQLVARQSTEQRLGELEQQVARLQGLAETQASAIVQLAESLKQLHQAPPPEPLLCCPFCTLL